MPNINLFSKIVGPPLHQILVCLIYCPPPISTDSRESSNTALRWQIHSLHNDHPRFLLLGDFIDWLDLLVNVLATTFFTLLRKTCETRPCSNMLRRRLVSSKTLLLSGFKGHQKLLRCWGHIVSSNS